VDFETFKDITGLARWTDVERRFDATNPSD
jgi:hypothetical protein